MSMPSEQAPVPPYLVVDRDGWLYGFESFEQMEGELEEFDVQSGEYTAFDRSGRPVKLGYEGRGLTVAVADPAPQLTRIRGLVDAFCVPRKIAVDVTDDARVVENVVAAVRQWG